MTREAEIQDAWVRLCRIEGNEVEHGTGGYLIKRQGFGILASLTKNSLRYASLNVGGYGSVDLTKKEYESVVAFARDAIHNRQIQWRSRQADIVYHLIGKPTTTE